MWIEKKQENVRLFNNKFASDVALWAAFNDSQPSGVSSLVHCTWNKYINIVTKNTWKLEGFNGCNCINYVQWTFKNRTRISNVVQNPDTQWFKIQTLGQLCNLVALA